MTDIKQYINEYIYQYSEKKNFTPRTIENKRDNFRCFLSFAGDRPFDLDTVNAYFDEKRKRGVKPVSIKSEMKSFKAFTHYLKKKKIIEEDWGQELIIPRVHIECEPLLSAEAMEELIIVATTPGLSDHVLHRRQKAEMRFAARFALRTGLRKTELLKVKGSDLYLHDPDPKVLVHSKGASTDFQPLPLDMLKELEERATREKVFPVCIGTINDLLQKTAIKLNISANVHPHFHMLRKIYGTTLARNGVAMSMVSRLMRHSDISITQKFYIQYNLDESAHAMNTGHSLIRLSLTEDLVLQNFMDRTVKPYFKNDSRFAVSSMPNPQKRELIIRVAY